MNKYLINKRKTKFAAQREEMELSMRCGGNKTKKNTKRRISQLRGIEVRH